jgi:predicted AAA+ superfamily ATPase
VRKRHVKSPKVYWRDSGLLHAMLDVPDERTLLGQPWVGASWEGFVVEQVLGQLSSQGRSVGAYHFRTSDGRELDLVLDFGQELWAIEIKLSSAPGPDDLARLSAAADLVGAKRRFLVSQVGTPSGNDRTSSCSLPVFIETLREQSP